MKKRLLTGSAFVALIVIASLIAFTVGMRSSAEPSLATTGTTTGAAPGVSDVINAPAQSEITAVESIASEVAAPAEVVQVDEVPAIEPFAEIVRSEADQPRGPSEGIGIRGEWTIDVLEPDGRLVSHTEFNNHLVTAGHAMLRDLLASQKSAGKWQIDLWSDPLGICSNSSGAPTFCTTSEPGAATSGIAVFPNLVVESVGPGYGLVRLSGSITAANDASISQVVSKLSSCSPDVSPDTCVGTLGGFTNKVLDTPIPVLANQQVQLTVEISFSTIP